MGRCKNCKYFKRHISEFNQKYGGCNSNKILYGASYKTKNNICFVRKYKDYTRTRATDLLTYEDAEGYKAFHEVGEDFGCVHFKKR